MINIKQQQYYNQRIQVKQFGISLGVMHKPKPAKGTVVEFGNLNDNNKTQFLQFLLRNNISFERNAAKGGDDYVAKVTISTTHPTHNAKANKQNNAALGEKSKKSNNTIKQGNKKQASHSNNKNISINTKLDMQSCRSINNTLDKSIKITTPRKQTNMNSSAYNQSIKVIKNSSSSPLTDKKNNSRRSNPKIKGSNQNLAKSKTISPNSNSKQKISGKPIVNRQNRANNATLNTHGQFNQNKSSSPMTVRTKEFMTFQANSSRPNKSTNRAQNQLARHTTKQETSQPKNGKNYIIDSFKQRDRDSFHQHKQKITADKRKSIPKLKIQGLVGKKACQKQKIVEVNNQIKRKTEQDKQICELVNRYIKLFDLKLSGQRPIKWSFIQLIKTIQQIYNDAYQKNNQSLAQKGFSKMQNQNGLSGCNAAHNFIRYIKDYFLNKHKNEKLSHSNIINLLYSLCCYLENEKKLSYSCNNGNGNGKNASITVTIKQYKHNQILTITGMFLQTFQDFLCQIYQFEQLQFYLFIRSVVLTQLQAQPLKYTKPDRQKQKQKQKQNQTKDWKNHILEKDIIMGYKDVVKVLTFVLGHDEDLIEQYKIMVLSRINCHKQEQLQRETELKISGPQFMKIMIQDYRVKRVLMQQQLSASRQKQKQKLNKNVIFNNSLANYSLASQNTIEQMIQTISSGKRKQDVGLPFGHHNSSINMNNRMCLKNMGQHTPNSNISNIQQKQRQKQTEQLTFGEETQSNMERLLENNGSITNSLQHDNEEQGNQFMINEYRYPKQNSTNAQFWQCESYTQVFRKAGQNSIQTLMLQKMAKKVQQLFNILIQSKSEYNSMENKKNGVQKVQRAQPLKQHKNSLICLVLKKSINLLGGIIEMNKLKWFEQLKVEDPTQEDIETVQALQLSYRKLKHNPDAEGIGRLCKNILTVKQIMGQLEKLVVFL